MKSSKTSTELVHALDDGHDNDNKQDHDGYADDDAHLVDKGER